MAEFACRVRLLFEQMQRPPEFREQLKQILAKFNPRFTFAILNLPLRNYDKFFHYINERNYLYKRVVESQNPRSKMKRTELNYVQGQFDPAEEDEDNQSNDNENDDGEQVTNLQAIEQKNWKKAKKHQEPRSSKTLVQQRLEQSLERFNKTDKQTNVPTLQTGQSTNNYSRGSYDQSKMFCYNCGQKGHPTRFCIAGRQVVCLGCRDISHENLNCPKAQGNSPNPQ